MITKLFLMLAVLLAILAANTREASEVTNTFGSAEVTGTLTVIGVNAGCCLDCRDLRCNIQVLIGGLEYGYKYQINKRRSKQRH